jgi:two-component system, NtrC family, sensor kinase
MANSKTYKKSICAGLTLYVFIYLLLSFIAFYFITHFPGKISITSEIAMIIGIFIITFTATYLTMRHKLGKPLEKLADSFQTISSSTFKGESLPLHEDNEIGVMAIAFNKVLKDAVEKTNEMAEEIIERNKIQKALTKSEEQFQQMAEHIEEVLWLCSADGMQMHYVSPAYERIYGRTVEEFYKDPHVWLNDIHEEDRARVIKNFAENGIKGKNFSSTFRIIRPDGESRTVCDTGFPIFDQEGKLYRIAGTVRDITKQKKADEKLAKLRTLYEYILHSAGEGIYGLDPDGNTTFVNPAAANMLGYDTHELIGKSQHELIHHSKQDGTPYASEECPITLALNDGEVHKVDNEVFWKKDGTSFPIEYVSTPIRNTKNKVTGAVVIFRDISARIQMETELQMAQKLEAVGQLAAGIAHEINTPAQYVGDNIRFLNEGCKDIITILSEFDKLLKAAEQGAVNTEHVKQINDAIETADLDYLLEEMPIALNQSQEGIESISNIVRAMKEFSHPGSNDKDLVDLNHIIENTVTVTKNEWKYVSEIKLDLDKDLPSVPCYAQNIGQVFMNLIVNASHAIADVIDSTKNELGQISISTTKLENEVEIKISDTGKGIPDEIREKVFDPFFTTKGVGKGTGQGLAIARSAVTDKHNGTIKCESEVGKGTTFTICLPLKDAHTEITEDAA